MINFLLHSDANSHHSGLSEFLTEHFGRFGEFLDEVVLHGVTDTLKIVLFLFLTYMLLEFIEHKAKDETELLMRKAGVFGPVVGGILGVIPQCGFSTVAANLYTGGIIGLGTLIAVFLSTSDEMLVVLLSGNVRIRSVLLILVYKTLAGILVGFIIDFAIRMRRRNRTEIRRVNKVTAKCKAEAHTGDGTHSLSEHARLHSDDCHSHGEHDHGDHDHGEHTHTEKGGCGKDDGGCADHTHTGAGIVKCALRHTLSVAIYILIVTLALNSLIFFIGEETIARVMVDIPVLSHLVSALVGLVPNCAVSVALTQLALSGIISEGVMLSGLLSGAGVGLLVLIKTNSDPKEDFIVPAILVISGVVFGVIADLLPFITILG